MSMIGCADFGEVWKVGTTKQQQTNTEVKKKLNGIRLVNKLVSKYGFRILVIHLYGSAALYSNSSR